LPPRNQVIDAEERITSWQRHAEELAQTYTETEVSQATLQIQPYSTAAHEISHLVAQWQNAPATSRILTPNWGATASLSEAQFLRAISSQPLATALPAAATQISSELLEMLESECDPEAVLSFSDLVKTWAPGFQSLQDSLSQIGDLDSLRFLATYQQRVQEWL